MASEFETWVMRGLVAALGGWVVLLVGREVRQGDKRLEENREELDRTRNDFTLAMDRMSERFSTSIDQLNVTVSSLAGAISELRILVARECATREELKDQTEQFHRTVEQCRDNCPLKR